MLCKKKGRKTLRVSTAMLLFLCTPRHTLITVSIHILHVFLSPLQSYLLKFDAFTSYNRVYMFSICLHTACLLNSILVVIFCFYQSVGSVLRIVGLGLSFVPGGGLVGGPLSLAGAAVGTAGAATIGVTKVVEAAFQRKGIKKVQEVLNMDRYKTQQMHILLQRATINPDFAEVWNIDPVLIFNAGRALPGFAKAGLASSNTKNVVATEAAKAVATGARFAKRFDHHAATTGQHIAGLVQAAATLPLNIVQIVVNSIRIHKKKQSKLVDSINSKANKLEHELRQYLIGEGYFQLINTIDGKWAYIVINVDKKLEFDERFEQGLTLKELDQFGDVAESGEGEVPERIQCIMYNDWYSHKNADELKILQDMSASGHK